MFSKQFMFQYEILMFTHTCITLRYNDDFISLTDTYDGDVVLPVHTTK